MDDKNTGKLEQFSAKVTQETKLALKELFDSGDFQTANQMMETLVERYYMPKKAKDQSTEIEKLKIQLEELKAQNSELTTDNSQLTTDNSQLTTQNSELTTQVQELTTQLENGKLPENCKIIKLDPINLAILNFVAKRESKARKQNWSVDDVINYFVHFRFEKGSLNGDLNSVSDKDIAEMKKLLEQE